MQKIKTTHVVLVELDALLDTRIATVARLYPQQAAKLLNQHYRNRPSDQFKILIPELDEDAYASAYAGRDTDTLAAARPTDMVIILSDIVDDLVTQIATGSPLVNSLSVEVNTYPYKLTSEEMDELSKAVSELTGIVVPVTAVYIPYESLDYDVIRANKYSVMVLYNYQDWFSKSHRKYTTRPVGCPDVTIVAPALVVNGADLREEQKFTLPNGRVMDPFDATTAAVADLVCFTFLPVAAFSLIDPGATASRSSP